MPRAHAAILAARRGVGDAGRVTRVKLVLVISVPAG